MEGLRQAAAPTMKVMVREVPTEVQIGPQGTALNPAASTTEPSDPDAEITTTPQAAPERLAPPKAPEKPTPSPTPTPKP
jgi:hypothetical protein